MYKKLNLEVHFIPNVLRYFHKVGSTTYAVITCPPNLKECGFSGLGSGSHKCRNPWSKGVPIKNGIYQVHTTHHESEGLFKKSSTITKSWHRCVSFFFLWSLCGVTRSLLDQSQPVLSTVKSRHDIMLFTLGMELSVEQRNSRLFSPFCCCFSCSTGNRRIF